MSLITARGNPFAGDWGAALGLGMLYHQTRVTALGHNPSIDIAGAPADVWEGGGAYPFQAAATQLEVLSASANDTAAGTGARSVTIVGLDANYKQITEVVILNGTTLVPTVNLFLRVNVFNITSAGSGEVNAGDITLRVVSAGATQGVIKANYGFGRSCIYTVPADNTLFIIALAMSVVQPVGTNANSAVFGVFGVFRRSSTKVRLIPIEFNITSNQPYVHPAQLGIILPQKTDFTLRVTGVSQNATSVVASMEGILVGNDVIAT